jgi:hypothetical protein
MFKICYIWEVADSLQFVFSCSIKAVLFVASVVLIRNTDMLIDALCDAGSCRGVVTL